VASVGIFGGTFNPPHVGHLVCAGEARAQLGLEHVVLVPAGDPPHKRVPGDPGPEHRLAMCELAAEDETWLSVSGIEVGRPGPSYTVDTLRQVHANHPGDELTFIVGGDMAWSLPSWREPKAILGLARLAVAERSGVRREDLRERLGSLCGADRIEFIDMPRLDISSSDIRRRVVGGRPIRHLVPGRVASYLEQRRLYA
jgi:nicotinate-nucleotide adenylyltransferase